MPVRQGLYWLVSIHYPPLTPPLSHIYFAEAGGGALDEQPQKELEILFS